MQPQLRRRLHQLRARRTSVTLPLDQQRDPTGQNEHAGKGDRLQTDLAEMGDGDAESDRHQQDTGDELEGNAATAAQPGTRRSTETVTTPTSVTRSSCQPAEPSRPTMKARPTPLATAAPTDQRFDRRGLDGGWSAAADCLSGRSMAIVMSPPHVVPSASALAITVRGCDVRQPEPLVPTSTESVPARSAASDRESTFWKRLANQASITEDPQRLRPRLLACCCRYRRARGAPTARLQATPSAGRPRCKPARPRGARRTSGPLALASTMAADAR